MRQMDAAPWRALSVTPSVRQTVLLWPKNTKQYVESVAGFDNESPRLVIGVVREDRRHYLAARYHRPDTRSASPSRTHVGDFG